MTTKSTPLHKITGVRGESFLLENVARMLGRSSVALPPPLDEAIVRGPAFAGHHVAFATDSVLHAITESVPAPARLALRREVTSLPMRHVPAHQAAAESCSAAHRLIMNGDVAAGVRVAQRVLVSPDAVPAARLDAEACLILGHFLLGGPEAERLAERILRERGNGPGDIAAMMALMIRSDALWRAGALGEALSLGRTAVRHGENVDPVWRLHFQLALAEKLADLREFDRAASLIDDAEAGLRGLPAPVWTAAAAAMRSRLLLQAGRVGDALREATLATSAAEPHAVPLLEPLAHAVLCIGSLYMEDLPAAVAHLPRADHAWAEILVAARTEGPWAAVDLLSGKHRCLPRQRSLYVEVPSAAAILVLLAREVGDGALERDVLETVNGLAADNAGIGVVGLTAMHANALAKGASAALALIVVQSPDPISAALATEELAKLYAAKKLTRLATGWSQLSEMERRITSLVSAGLTNRQIAKQVHLSAHTVNYHLRKVYKKLGINTRVELAHAAVAYAGVAEEAS
ncbi:helix-turn-helix transcriptional regulator [Actinoplanes aureus]|nr:helix-turn-helix transcriptional regulator [Actinoplanes aureus]